MGQYKYVIFLKSVPALKGSERKTHEREHEIQRENDQKQYCLPCQINQIVELPVWLTLQSPVLQGFLIDFCSYGVWELFPLCCPLTTLGNFFMRPKGQFLGSKDLKLPNN